MAEYPHFPGDIWGLILDQLEPYLFILLPCVCKSFHGSLIPETLSTLRVTNGTVIRRGMNHNMIVKSLANVYGRHSGSTKLSRLHLTAYELRTDDVNRLLPLVAHNLRRIRLREEISSLLTLDWTKLEELRSPLHLQENVGDLVAPSTSFSDLKIVDIALPNNLDVAKQVLEKLASTQKAQFVELTIRLNRQLDLIQLLPSISAVSFHHSSTLQKLCLCCGLRFQDWIGVLLNINSTDVDSVLTLNQRCLDVFGIPAHRLRLDNLDGDLLFVHLLFCIGDDLNAAYLDAMYSQLLAPITSVQGKTQEFFEIFRRLDWDLGNDLPVYSHVTKFLLARIEDKMMDPEVVGFDQARKFVALVVLMSASCGDNFEEQHPAVIARLGSEDGLASCMLSLKIRSQRFHAPGLYQLLQRPFWKQPFLRLISSKQSPLLTPRDDWSGAVTHPMILHFFSDEMDLSLENAEGWTLVDAILDVSDSDTLRMLGIVSEILSSPRLSKQLFERISILQLKCMFSCLLQYGPYNPSYPVHVPRIDLVIPRRAVELVEDANSDDAFVALFSGFRWCFYQTAALEQDRHVGLEEVISKFEEHFRSLIPNPSAATESRFSRLLPDILNSESLEQNLDCDLYSDTNS
eukprot:TRINITY_DN3912_c0_g2_i1.p1 TRINITY_DN3912_c0_g2~~TRINITY_DN3912_c0_g2_i1.p1  ORF type:complete len:630 (-),score=72.47 TRINITY_DN3912_c0_g2_i1:127-2016(-)